MVSMVIVLFLVAVLVSLFFGRLAETLADRYRRRAEKGKCQPVFVQPAADTAKSEIILIERNEFIANRPFAAEAADRT